MTPSAPPIKSQGIKTKLTPWIKSVIPENFSGVWIEPFLGTGAVLFNIKPKKAIVSDTNPHIINFYKSIQDSSITPNIVRNFLESEGKKLSEVDDYYYTVRDRFNKGGDPLDFLFVNRASFNGMVRFNRKGGFNVPFCKKPNRFSKAYITKISNQVDRVKRVLNNSDYTFINGDFNKVISQATINDLIYADPPYIDRHSDYFNSWTEDEENRLFKELKSSGSKFILSTWHHNRYRSNSYIDTLWGEFNILIKEHFYHIGGSEENRNSMMEALITNFRIDKLPSEKAEKYQQLTLF